jgi:hypothetical protein
MKTDKPLTVPVVGASGKNNIQYGKNNHIEYAWSSFHREQIVQLFYQLVRTSDNNQLQMLGNVFNKCFINSNKEEKILLLKILAHTRDIEQGKGEYMLSFVLLKELMTLDNGIFIEMIKLFVGYNGPITDSNLYIQKKPTYGSWKDMKYYMQYISDCPNELVTIINDQLSQDVINMTLEKPCSLVAKWIPRETSKKFGWINIHLAKDYYKDFGKYGWSISATRKAQTHYRKILSQVNKYIDTVQIKQCNHMWSKIDFNKVTSNTIMKQKTAFLNNNNKMNNINLYNFNNKDRICCREKMIIHLEKVKKGISKMNGKNISMIDIVKSAINIIDIVKLATNIIDTVKPSTITTADEQNLLYNNEEANIINELWNNNSIQTASLDNMIALIDISSSMEQDKSEALYAAIGMSIRVAEKSTIGKRIMAFTNKPSWINLDDCPDFISCVKKVTEIEYGMNADIYKAMDFILDTIIQNKIPPSEVENLVFVIFSDMQFDMYSKDNDSGNINTIKNIFRQKFDEAGKQICGQGYKVPHIIFWNMKSTNSFPELSYQTDISMMSGYNPTLLNKYMTKGDYGTERMTPWLKLNNILNSSRYNNLNKLI